MPAEKESSNGVSPMLASHEGRLQRVEEAVGECSVGIAEARGEIEVIKGKIEGIAGDVREGFSALVERLDKDNQRHDNIDERHTAMVEELKKLHPRLEAIDPKHKARAKQISGVKKAGIGLVLAGLGGAVAKAGEYLFTLWK